MAEKIVLEATKRAVLGKQVRQLRRKGLIPGVLYGPGFDSMPIQVDWLTLRPALLRAGGTQIIQLNVDGDEYNTLVRKVQRSPLRHDIVLHVDFYRVRMDVAIRTEIPIVLKGDVRELETLGGTINQEMNAVMVECLPGDLPHEIQIDISGLKQIGDMILASALPELPGVTYHVDPGVVVVTTTYLTRPEEEELAAAGAAEPELVRRRAEEEEDEEV
jgi:large subunit ribosomal protein L25